MTLFLIINIVMISCGSGGPAPKEGQAAKSDGTVIDLLKVSKKIKDAVEFAASVKEVHTLVKSVDELAKAIGKKIKEDGTLDTLNNKNGSLLAGAFQVILTVETKLKELEKKNGLSDSFKAKITNAKGEGTGLVNKLKGGHAELGIEGATDDNAQKAVDRVGKADGDKGVAELVKLNTAIDELLQAANGAVSSAIAELTISAKAAIPGQS
ncbi:Vsp/OspC family lipoprotein [Borrelia miyamotoi]|uniref:Vsp/OspC family lipoprotein n=2 Tax=Borrelia miyamotoi TaxID=47466 RepID=A0AAQ2WXE5_9SPIR|nr:Vsp/OspC family lipoprotein [Borrelia miyamotoi]WAZ86014.1 Vsp/OspC family lipoprotein [Borrelia miyamotoi]WAZ91797.1 Vsp/OspC family lipoprotein [Borrelia miyamotoi]WAZ92872.1 Vsp/OspC family lipoprotein [Borrelia miyamotoi]WAZ93090.1 Vsp/OspC family lipoprotein [Borrelia miyamotoi]WAZ94382.1 Vsp/OspC family lipoprotein [Borrelia miyamotoi]